MLAPPPAPDPVRPRDPSLVPGPTPALAPRPTPEHCPSRTRSGPAPPPPPHLRPPPRQHSLRAERNRAEPRAERRPLQQWSPGAGPPPPPPQQDSGSGSDLSSGSARSSSRRQAAAGLEHRAGAYAPPAPLRSAPGGARRSGPAPRPMGREPRAGGGAGETKEGAGPRRGGAAGQLAPESAAQTRRAERIVRSESAQQAMLTPNPKLRFVGLACITERVTEAQGARSAAAPSHTVSLFTHPSFIHSTNIFTAQRICFGVEANLALPRRTRDLSGSL